MNLLRICLLLIGLASTSAYAQYAPVESAPSAAEKRELALASAREKLVGRRFWIVPNVNANTRKEFFGAEEDGAVGKEKFVVTEPTSFTITAFFVADNFQNYVKIAFADGKIAYLKERILFRGDPNKYSIFDDLYELGGPRYEFIEYILPEPPEDLRAAEQKLKAKSGATAAAWKARGGVAIGMTAKQVRASNWGAPESINRSSGTYGVHEQWVYGGGNYVYLQNGKVTSIQN